MNVVQVTHVNLTAERILRAVEVANKFGLETVDVMFLAEYINGMIEREDERIKTLLG